MSGSFCVSMTAAIGMPKFETGPQKSAVVVTIGVSGSGFRGIVERSDSRGQTQRTQGGRAIAVGKTYVWSRHS